MPPPRRRRPVQPATRVRLPRATRPRPDADAPQAGSAERGLPPDETGQQASAGEVREQPTGSLALPSQAPADEQDQSAAVESPATDEVTQAAAADGAPEAAAADGVTQAADEVARPARADRAGDEGDKPVGGAAEPADATDASADADSEADADAEGSDAGSAPARDRSRDGKAAVPGRVAGPGRRHPLLVPACLGVVAVALGGLATWFGLEAGSIGSGADTQNIALTNATATRQVSQQIDAAVNTIFSYNYANTAKTRQAAQRLLTGKASQQYNTLFKLVTADAPQEKLVLTTTVTNSGVERLEGGRARLLIFINQSDTSNSAHKTTDAGAMFAVNAVRQGSTWKIDNIDDFSGT